MRKCISLILSSVLVFSFMVFFNMETHIKDVQASTPTLTLYTENNKIELKDKITNESNEHMEMILNIPYVQGLNNKEFEKIINNDISSYINSMKKEFEDVLQRDLLYAKTNGFSLPKYEIKSTYVVTYNDENLLSFTITSNSFTGGSYSTSNKKSYNIDLKNSRLLKLQHLFSEEQDFQQVINNKISEDIAKDRNKYYSNKFRGIDYDQSFYLEKESIVIHFPMNEITPYVVGVPEFKIPLNSLELPLDLKTISTSSRASIKTMKNSQQNKDVNINIKLPKIEIKDMKLTNKINDYIQKDVDSFVKSIENESRNRRKTMNNSNEVFIPYNVNISYRVFTNTKEKIKIELCKSHFDGNNFKNTEILINIDLKTGEITNK
ncbi:hypothetical protein J2Z44_003932 [Clostridium punense]|uniref:DUF3298 domain-containing protein n=1 Tax=Clostridium punense TaxID=1054297 RepID=A0ABS4K8H7_9CLOT|nr:MULTISPECIES: DUF4163 domain-containing protein [Clostridium]EQB89224.1 hypothetical protein M918_21355 [Clostridium sp. BL8]MBP2024082.1 hypothetical protein [Clostridium punense]